MRKMTLRDVPNGEFAFLTEAPNQLMIVEALPVIPTMEAITARIAKRAKRPVRIVWSINHPDRVPGTTTDILDQTEVMA